jgi:hypothetical protein
MLLPRLALATHSGWMYTYFQNVGLNRMLAADTIRLH